MEEFKFKSTDKNIDLGFIKEENIWKVIYNCAECGANGMAALCFKKEQEYLKHRYDPLWCRKCLATQVKENEIGLSTEEIEEEVEDICEGFYPQEWGAESCQIG